MTYRYEIQEHGSVIKDEVVADSMHTAVLMINMEHPDAHVNKVTLVREDSNWRKRSNGHGTE